MELTEQTLKTPTGTAMPTGTAAPTLDDLWAYLLKSSEEFDRQLKKSREEDEQRKQEHERWKKESREEFDRKMEESKAEADKRIRKTEQIVRRNSRQMGDLHNTFGELAEHLVAPGIARRFNELGFHFDAIAPGGLRILDEQGKIKTEVDLILENGDYIIATEVKVKPKIQDIEHHYKRIEILKEHRQKKNEKPKKILGAIAGAVFGLTEKDAALSAGLYVLEQSGDTMKMELPGDFTAREW